MLKTAVTSPLVAIAGRVVESKTGQVVAGAMVKIIAMPEVLQTKLSLQALQYGEKWEKMPDRIDRKITAHDGYFFFINLPPGDYVLETFLPTNVSRYEKVTSPVKVSNPINNKIPTTMMDDIVLVVKQT